MDACRVLTRKIPCLRLCRRAQLIVRRPRLLQKYLSQCLEIDIGQVHPPAAVVTHYDRGGDRYPREALVQQCLDPRGAGRNVHRAELASDRLGDDVQHRHRFEVRSGPIIRQQRLVRQPAWRAPAGSPPSPPPPSIRPTVRRLRRSQRFWIRDPVIADDKGCAPRWSRPGGRRRRCRQSLQKCSWGCTYTAKIGSVSRINRPF